MPSCCCRRRHRRCHGAIGTLGGSARADPSPAPRAPRPAPRQVEFVVKLLPAVVLERIQPKGFRNSEKKRRQGAEAEEDVQPDARKAPAVDEDVDLGSVTITVKRKSERRNMKHAKRHTGANTYWDENEDEEEMKDPINEQYKLIERELLMYLDETDESRAKFDEYIWSRLDYQDVGLTSLSELDKLIRIRFPVLHSTPAMFRAYARMAAHVARPTRRTWIEYHQVLDLLTRFFYCKRFYDIVPDSVHKPNKRIEYREFKYLLRRVMANVGGDSEAQNWFAGMASEGSSQRGMGPSVLLDDAAEFVTTRTFHPFRQNAGADPHSKLDGMSSQARHKVRAAS